MERCLDQYQKEEEGQEVPPDVTFDPDDDTPKRVKYYVNDVPVSIINERVQYLDADGKLITESLVDYTRKNIRKEYATLDEFLQRWNSAQKKTAIVEELEQKGIFFEELREEISKDLDPFDLINALFPYFDRMPKIHKAAVLHILFDGLDIRRILQKNQNIQSFLTGIRNIGRSTQVKLEIRMMGKNRRGNGPIISKRVAVAPDPAMALTKILDLLYAGRRDLDLKKIAAVFIKNTSTTF